MYQSTQNDQELWFIIYEGTGRNSLEKSSKPVNHPYQDFESQNLPWTVTDGLLRGSLTWDFSHLSRIEWTTRCLLQLLSMRPTSLCHQWHINEVELFRPSQGVFTHFTTGSITGHDQVKTPLKSVDRYLSDFDFAKKSFPLSIPLDDDATEFKLGNW